MDKAEKFQETINNMGEQYIGAAAKLYELIKASTAMAAEILERRREKGNLTEAEQNMVRATTEFALVSVMMEKNYK